MSLDALLNKEFSHKSAFSTVPTGDGGLQVLDATGSVVAGPFHSVQEIQQCIAELRMGKAYKDDSDDFWTGALIAFLGTLVYVGVSVGWAMLLSQ